MRSDHELRKLAFEPQDLDVLCQNCTTEELCRIVELQESRVNVLTAISRRSQRKVDVLKAQLEALRKARRTLEEAEDGDEPEGQTDE